MNRVKLYATMLVASFVMMCLSAPYMNWVFVVSFVGLMLSCYLIHRDRKLLDGDIDELFGRDSDF